MPLRAAEDVSPARLAARLKTLVEPEGFLTVAVPSMHSEMRRSLGMNLIARLWHALSGDVRVVFTQTPVVADPPEPVPERVVALVLAAEAADPEAQALTYARSVGAAEIRAVHIALDPEGEQENIRDQWARRGFDPPLEVVDAPLRHLGPPLIAEARHVIASADTLLNVIVPIVVGAHRGGPLGHRHARYVEGLFVHTPRVMVSLVPFLLPAAS